VPDAYAQTSLKEDYAQMQVVFLYKLWNPYNPPKGTKCLAAQLNAIANSEAAGLQDYIKATGAPQKRPNLHPTCSDSLS
jgi:hypothetical protein